MHKQKNAMDSYTGLYKPYPQSIQKDINSIIHNWFVMAFSAA